MPIHELGNTIWKELKALEAIILTDTYEATSGGEGLFGDTRDQLFGFTLTLMGGGHEHDVIVNAKKAQLFGTTSPSPSILLRTEIRNGHAHYVKVQRSREATDDAFSEWKYTITLCRFSIKGDRNVYGRCKDGHATIKRSRVGSN